MISSLRGTVLDASAGRLVIEVAGVGFTVHVTADHAASLHEGQETLVHTSMVVREDSMSLFGFASRDQLDVFDLLTSVNGVGPKSALGVLAALTPDQIARAVADDDDRAFRAVSGIGPKTAKLIVVSLAGKLAPARPAASGSATAPAATLADSVVVALVGLGWSERVAGEAVGDIIAHTDEAQRQSVSALLRLALAQLGPAAHTAEAGR